MNVNMEKLIAAIFNLSRKDPESKFYGNVWFLFFSPSETSRLTHRRRVIAGIRVTSILYVRKSWLSAQLESMILECSCVMPIILSDQRMSQPPWKLSVNLSMGMYKLLPVVKEEIELDSCLFVLIECWEITRNLIVTTTNEWMNEWKWSLSPFPTRAQKQILPVLIKGKWKAVTEVV